MFENCCRHVSIVMVYLLFIGSTSCPNSLYTVLNELHHVAPKWKMIGLGLCIPHHRLEALDKGDEDSLKCLQGVISMWLEEAELHPTWEALIDVLASRVVGEMGLAERLRMKFCSVSRYLPETPIPTGTYYSYYSYYMSYTLFIYNWFICYFYALCVHA